MRKLSDIQKLGIRDALLSSAFYALGFIVTKLALDAWSPATVSFLRILVAAVGGLVFLALTRKLSTLSGHWKISLVAGFAFGAELFMISLGLSGTSVSSGVFIANTYVVLVPLFLGMNLLFSLKGLQHLFFVSLSLTGVVLVSDFEKVTLASSGDFLCLLTSIVTTGHIVAVQKAAKDVTSSFAFNICQCIWGSLFLGVGFFALDGSNPIHSATPMTWVYILSAGIIATLIATMYQISSQVRIGAAASSLLFMMDAPFAALFGVFMLSEVVNGMQLLGGITILLSSVAQFSVDWQSAKNKNAAEAASSPLVSVNDNDRVA